MALRENKKIQEITEKIKDEIKENEKLKLEMLRKVINNAKT